MSVRNTDARSRERIFTEIRSTSIDFEQIFTGSVSEFIDVVKSKLSEFVDTETEFHVLETEQCSDYVEFRVVTYRLETDEEYKSRIQRIDQHAAAVELYRQKRIADCVASMTIDEKMELLKTLTDEFGN